MLPIEASELCGMPHIVRSVAGPSRPPFSLIQGHHRPGSNIRSPMGARRLPQAHSDEFRAVRDSVLGLEEVDCVRLAALLGAQGQEPKPPIGDSLASLLVMVGSLEYDDRRRLAGWFQRYVNEWGQIPEAASQRRPKFMARSTTIPAGGRPRDN